MAGALQLALDAVPAAIFLYQPDQILYANRTAAALLGCSAAEVVGLRFSDVFDAAPEPGSATCLKSRSGSIGVTVTNEEIEFDGSPVRLITALRRKPAELPITDSQRLFESIFESSVVGIAIFNEGAYYVRVNRTYAEIYGYTPDEMIGKHFFLIFPPEFHERAQETHDRFIRGETRGARSDWTVQRKDGQQIEISAFNNRVVTESGERFRIVAVIDISEQKHAQRALQLSEERLNSLLTSMGDAVWSVWAETLQPFYVNPAIEALTGYPVAAFMTQKELLFDIVHPEDRAYFLEQMHKALTEKQVGLEHRIIRRDGSVRWVHKRFWVVVSPEGNRISGLMTDITDRRLAVEQAMQLKLENERVRILSGFVSDASHEFRTPLTIISTHLDLMARNTNPLRQPSFIAGIRAQTTRILTLVEALITMSRFDSLTGIRLEPVHLSQLLPRLRATQQEFALRKGILFTLHPVPANLVIQGDADELMTAFHAIVANAIVYTPEGGRVDIRAYLLGDREIAVDVVDTGIGISKDEQPRIFERFYRVDQSHSTQGFGLGLPIARRIVELHHGRIDVESDLGKGCRFRLVFPAHPVD